MREKDNRGMWSDSRQFPRAACKCSAVNEICVIGGTGIVPT